MRVLILGGSGQVGRALLKSVPPGILVQAPLRAALDITAADQIEQVIAGHRPELIINAAAYTAVDRAEGEPEKARGANIEAPASIARIAHHERIRLIHLSTDFVFDGSSSRPYRPDAISRPLNVYGSTKRAGELAVLQAAPGVAVVLRTSWVYAIEGRNFVLTMLRLMREQTTVRVVLDQVGTPTSADSLAQALWRMAGEPGLRGIHHWSDDGVASWYDFAVAIMEEAVVLGLLPRAIEVLPIDSASFGSAAQRPAYSVLDKSDTVAALGLRPFHWRQELRRVLKEMARA